MEAVVGVVAQVENDGVWSRAVPVETERDRPKNT